MTSRRSDPACVLARPTLRLFVAAACAASLAVTPLAGCDQPSEPTLSKRSKLKVKLPAPPDLSERVVEVKHADGTYTVQGLLSERHAALGTKVRVRGQVVEAVGCPERPVTGPDAAESSDVGPPPPRTDCYPPPHVFLVDPGATDRRLLVGGPPGSGLETAVKGRVLTLEGDFDMVSPDGAFIRQGGLLVVAAEAAEAAEGPAPEE